MKLNNEIWRYNKLTPHATCISNHQEFHEDKQETLTPCKATSN